MPSGQPSATMQGIGFGRDGRLVARAPLGHVQICSVALQIVPFSQSDELLHGNTHPWSALHVNSSLLDRCAMHTACSSAWHSAHGGEQNVPPSAAMQTKSSSHTLPGLHGAIALPGDVSQIAAPPLVVSGVPVSLLVTKAVVCEASVDMSDGKVGHAARHRTANESVSGDFMLRVACHVYADRATAQVQPEDRCPTLARRRQM